MNILVTGANGQLGNEIRIVSQGSDHHYFFTDVCNASSESVYMIQKLAGYGVSTETLLLDITDLSAIRAIVEKHNIQVVINCAAYTNVDAAEEYQELAMLLNAKAPENLALAMKEVNGLLIHISTDYVFGKEPYNVPCREDQKGTPTGVYGYTKLCGEQNIQAVGSQYVIIRTAWLYSEFGKNFCKTMLNLTASKPQLKVVFDQVGTPTYAYDLAKVISVILEDYKLTLNSQLSTINYPQNGTYHFSNEGVCSWYDFAKQIQKYAVESETPETAGTFGAHGACAILPCHTSEFPSPVKRPSYSVLDKTKIKQTFSLTIPYWTDSLKQCIAHLK